MALDENSSKQILKAKIRFFRERAGLTQEETAEKLNMTRNKYWYLETKAKKVSASDLNRLAVIFNIQPEEFLPDSTSSSTVKLETPHSEYKESNKSMEETLLLMIYRKFNNKDRAKYLNEFKNRYAELVKSGEIPEDIF